MLYLRGCKIGGSPGIRDLLCSLGFRRGHLKATLWIRRKANKTRRFAYISSQEIARNYTLKSQGIMLSAHKRNIDDIGSILRNNWMNFASLELSPQPIPFIPSLLAPFMLFMDLFYMISFLFNCSFEPETALLCRSMTSRSIGTRFGVVIPRRICDE